MASVKVVKAIILDSKADVVRAFKQLKTDPKNRTALSQYINSAIKNLESARNLISESEKAVSVGAVDVKTEKPKVNEQPKTEDFSF